MKYLSVLSLGLLMMLTVSSAEPLTSSYDKVFEKNIQTLASAHKLLPQSSTYLKQLEDELLKAAPELSEESRKTLASQLFAKTQESLQNYIAQNPKSIFGKSPGEGAKDAQEVFDFFGGSLLEQIHFFKNLEIKETFSLQKDFPTLADRSELSKTDDVSIIVFKSTGFIADSSDALFFSSPLDLQLTTAHDHSFQNDKDERQTIHLSGVFKISLKEAFTLSLQEVFGNSRLIFVNEEAYEKIKTKDESLKSEKLIFLHATILHELQHLKDYFSTPELFSEAPIAVKAYREKFAELKKEDAELKKFSEKKLAGLEILYIYLNSPVEGRAIQTEVEFLKSSGISLNMILEEFTKRWYAGNTTKLTPEQIRAKLPRFAREKITEWFNHR
ncbi:MAG: hypothetical protein J0L93_08570 [Deltaproteobacteria bacterium]|nr:hypothetical protein [Deltaproteobacteria bacterium]